MYITAFNTTDSPVVIDDEGRTLDGKSFGPVLSTSEPVKAALDRDALVKVDADTDADSLDSDAKKAIEATRRLEDARSPAKTAEVAEELGAPMTKRAAKAAAKEA